MDSWRIQRRKIRQKYPAFSKRAAIWWCKPSTVDFQPPDA
jgi:hypothetical protein